MGGNKERDRAEQLKKRVRDYKRSVNSFFFLRDLIKMFLCFLFLKFKVVPDNPSEKVMSLKENKKVKHRTKIVFGTGEFLRAVTTTSNAHFVRAAESQVGLC